MKNMKETNNDEFIIEKKLINTLNMSISDARKIVDYIRFVRYRKQSFLNSLCKDKCSCTYESSCHGIEMIKSPSGVEWAVGGVYSKDKWNYCPWCGLKIERR